MYFHGHPSSRIEAAPADDVARKHNIRLIALDRPGFGLSTPSHGAQLLDWPNDVHHFAGGVGMDRFAVFGLSGGGPFALAWAYALPREMLTGVGLFASGPPWKAGRHHMTLTRRTTSWMTVHWPSGLRAILNGSVAALTSMANSKAVIKRLDAFLEKDRGKLENRSGTEEAERIRQTKAERRETLLSVLVDEPFRQGSDAAVLEAELLSANGWGF
ncbi:hypothetical protein K431DRAFT_281911 [Polychaeton citri CBS 116435]|uniref:Alpha/beta-hydrolase n=1 Tax=Polychaeton citri CBS 116435 TaxID=1314669 RepID=A0A9P4QGT1_9PEZI|nr:hypothetical protein K431DRAFT_281911 [Polychaeton citri CBS 116435]